MYERSDSFRQSVGLERVGVNPTMTYAPSDRTMVTTSYEYLHDRRVADRGITSFQGRAVPVDPSKYYGNPNDSYVRANVHLASALVEHRLNHITIRNRSTFGDYDKGYQNYVPGVTAADRSTVALSAYNNATRRQNLFNQTDLVSVVSTGGVQHTLVVGSEFGRQLTDNFRNTGFFNNTATTVNVPYNDTVIATPVVFRQSATDADNHLRANVAAAFVQDQVEWSRHVQFIGGCGSIVSISSITTTAIARTLPASTASCRPEWDWSSSHSQRFRSIRAIAFPICRVPATSSPRLLRSRSK